MNQEMVPDFFQCLKTSGGYDIFVYGLPCNDFAVMRTGAAAALTVVINLCALSVVRGLLILC